MGLARALMLKPAVLLLDNPLAGLDLRHATWWLGTLVQLSQGRGPMSAEPVTLVATAADLRPWKGLARQFATLKQQRLTVLGDRAQLEAASDELIGELLAAEPRGD